MNINQLFFLLIMVLFCSSCNRNAKTVGITISFKNVSGQDIKMMDYIADNKYSCTYSYIAKMDKVPFLNPPQKVPKSVWVLWDLADGTKNEKELFLKKVPPNNFKGEVVYELLNNDIDIVFEADN